MKDSDNLNFPKPESHSANLSFLLRAWKEEMGKGSPRNIWRYSLMDLKTRAQRGFADLDSLVIYFRGIESDIDRNGDEEGTSQIER
jgi:hypothetical protein